MTMPRKIIPGASWLVTRRCLERRFFLRPDGFVGQLLLYVLGYVAGLIGLQIHAVVALSSHWHLVVTDPSGKICAFFERAHGLIARAMNRFRGRSGSFWDPGSRLSLVRLVTPEDVLRKIAYVLTNPCRHDIVDRASRWIGLVTTAEDLAGRVYEAERPKGFFRGKRLMPTKTHLRITRPPGFDHLSDEELVELVRVRVRAEEQKHRNRRRREGVRSLGAQRVLRRAWNSSASTPMPSRQLDPHIACHDQVLRASAIDDLKQFRAAYSKARAQFASGKRKALFPEGTYLMRVRFRVRCKEPGPPA